MDSCITFWQAYEFYQTFDGLAGQKATLPMILSEWHRLYGAALRLVALWQSLPERLGEAYWNNWLVDGSQALESLRTR